MALVAAIRQATPVTWEANFDPQAAANSIVRHCATSLADCGIMLQRSATQSVQ